MIPRSTIPAANTSSLRYIARFIWNNNKKPNSKSPDSLALADALNLLSDLNKTGGYRPSLYNNLTKGPAAEQFSMMDDFSKVLSLRDPVKISEQYINNLITGIEYSRLHSKSEPDYSQLYEMDPKDISIYVKGLTDERFLLKIMESFYHNQKLTPGILSSIILNRNFTHLKRSSIDLYNLEKNQHLNFLELEMNQIRIVLLKKFHDLHQPLSVIKNLKNYFQGTYLRLIERGVLLAFHERIIWRYVLEYLKQYDASYYIKSIDKVRSSILIWEVSHEDISQIARYILKCQGNSLNEVQTLFLKIAADPIVQNRIQEEVDKYHNSKLLSGLKRISVKYKISSWVPSPENEEYRKVYYALLSDLEIFVSKMLVYESSGSELEALRDELTTHRANYIRDMYMQQEQDGKRLLDDLKGLLNRT